MAQDHDGARIRGYDFSNQLQQLPLQLSRSRMELRVLVILNSAFRSRAIRPDICSRREAERVGAYVRCG